MRLTCPNCGAQYEVPEEAIPEDGRDVQCSNCGDTWFQPSAKAMAQQTNAAAPLPEDIPQEAGAEDLTESEGAASAVAPDEAAQPEAAPYDDIQPEGAESEETATEVTTDIPTDVAAPEAMTEAMTEATTEPEPSPEPVVEPLSEPAPEPSPAASPAASLAGKLVDGAGHRKLDPQISKVLREEAERETALRNGMLGGVETQPELGLTEPEAEIEPEAEYETGADAQPQTFPSDTVEAETDQAEKEAHGPSDPQDAPLSQQPDLPPSSRRNLLPDIENVDSDLSSSMATSTARNPELRSPYANQPLEDTHQRRGGFLRGFLLSLLLMGIAIFTYANAAPIVEHLPQTEPALSAYVNWVNGLREALAGLVRPTFNF